MTFIRGGDVVLGQGDIYVKTLPNGESVRLTSDAGAQVRPGVHTGRNPGSRIRVWLPRAGIRGAFRCWAGEPSRLLPNASGLTWITDRHVLFSEIKTGLHMGIVTATEGRAERARSIFSRTSTQWRTTPMRRRIVSWCSSSRCSARTLSINRADSSRSMEALPDGRSVLEVPARRRRGLRTELDVLRRDRGRQLAPLAPEVPGRRTRADHVRSPRGGGDRRDGAGRPVLGDIGRDPSECALDSRRRRRTGDLVGGLRRGSSPFQGCHPRVLSSCAGLCAIGTSGWVASSSELRSVDLASGKTNSVLPGASVTDYDVSRDETEVAFTATEALESRTSGWHPSTGAHRRARSPKAEIRCRSALTENSSSGR